MIHKSRMGKRMMAMLLCGTLTFTSVVPAMASELPETEAAVQSALTEEKSAVETGSPEETSAVAENQDVGGVKQEVDAVDQPTDETKEETGVTDETTDADSDTSNAIPESQDPQEEAQQSDVAELALDGESDAVPLEYDGTITAEGTLTEGSFVTVKSSTTEEKSYYYTFSPETTGYYYFQGASDKIINGYCESFNEEIENANGLMHLAEGKTYYFCFSSCDGEEAPVESEVMLVKKIALDGENTKIQIEGTSCELAEGQYFNLPKVKYTLSYTNDECTWGEIGACEEIIEGIYDEQYVFALENVDTEGKELYLLNNTETGLSKGTYKVWLYDEICNEKIVEAEGYRIEVKGFADFKANELSAGTDISVKMSPSYKNEYTYYTFTAEKDAYYLQLNSFDSSYINVYYYDKEGKCRQLKLRGNLLKTQKDTTYYVTFNVYSEEEENEIDTVTADFGIKKNINSYKIIEGKTDYLSLIDTPLSDWALLITYEGETMPVEYQLNHLNTYWDWDSETEAETAPLYNQDNYGNTLYCTFTKLRGSIEEKYETGETGKYTLKVGTDETDLKEYTVNITKPTPTDWKNNGRVLTVGDNTINTMADDDIYFFFRPERTWEYILSDTKWTMDRDSILSYNGGSLYGTDYKFADDDRSIILPAKANTEYYLNAALWDETGTRTITIKEKNAHKHSYTSAVTKAPTCTTAGVRTYTCTASDDSYTESIPAAGHKLTTLPAKAAICTGTGLTEGKLCTACGTITVPQQTTPALGHAMGGWVTTQAPTALADGVQSRTCSRCGYAETAAIARLAATGFLNATNVPLKVKQSATLTVREFAQVL